MFTGWEIARGSRYFIAIAQSLINLQCCNASFVEEAIDDHVEAAIFRLIASVS
jgi:hypothetical protein